MSNQTDPSDGPPAATLYIVGEGKKRMSSREVAAESPHDRYVTVVRVHAGDALVTDNWHTNEVLTHARQNFEGRTFPIRTLEAWGASVESDRRGYFTAGGSVWVLDLQPAASASPASVREASAPKAASPANLRDPSAPK